MIYISANLNRPFTLFGQFRPVTNQYSVRPCGATRKRHRPTDHVLYNHGRLDRAVDCPGGKWVRDTETNVRIDFLIAGDFPGDGRPKAVSFPDPKHCRVEGERFSVLSLPMLIELKIASGMTAKDRPGDLQDVIRLIRARSLSREFQEQLDPYVRAKFLELWDATQVASDDY